MLEVFERNGLGLPAEQRDRLKEIKKRNAYFLRPQTTNESFVNSIGPQGALSCA